METVSQEALIKDLYRLGICAGDTLLIRADLGTVGRIKGGRVGFIEALLQTVGPEGTIVSLAFTSSSFLRKADPAKPFHSGTPTYAGALPQGMLDYPGAKRSAHPTCSFVAIGKYAETIIAGHDHTSPAYEPVRRVMQLDGKGVLVGCVKDSPGFTTAHLAEYDLGQYRRALFPWLHSVYFRDESGALRLFRRNDVGMCSMSYAKFYSHYIAAGILSSGFVGKAYSIMVPLAGAYRIESLLLNTNPQFNVCDNADCLTCNVTRWDRLHRLPLFVFRWVIKRLIRKLVNVVK